MDKFVKQFIFMGILYLIIASIMGVIMAINPGFISLRFAHVHLNLLGWMSMLIFGVGYHILPRFAGKVLYSNPLAQAQFYLANAGLIGMAGLATIGHDTSGKSLYSLFVISGVVEVISIMIFGYNMIMTLFKESEAT